MDQLLHLRKGRYLARTATSSTDLLAAHALRSLCFACPPDPAKGDPFDALCTHVLIEDTETHALLCCFRVFSLADARDLEKSYSAQFYDLQALAGFQGVMLEIGRFCIHPDHHDPDILRMAWGVLTQWVDARDVRLLFGCSSFAGDDAALHLDAFRLLHSKHRAPEHWRPRPKAPEIFDFETGLAATAQAAAFNPASLPPLLRTYLLMAGWVSDHAVYDRQLHTMHVFTGVEIAAIPPTRARLLRAVAG
jgi:putative hemolysin